MFELQVCFQVAKKTLKIAEADRLLGKIEI